MGYSSEGSQALIPATPILPLHPASLRRPITQRYGSPVHAPVDLRHVLGSIGRCEQVSTTCRSRAAKSRRAILEGCRQGMGQPLLRYLLPWYNRSTSGSHLEVAKASPSFQAHVQLVPWSISTTPREEGSEAWTTLIPRCLSLQIVNVWS